MVSLSRSMFCFCVLCFQDIFSSFSLFYLLDGELPVLSPDPMQEGDGEWNLDQILLGILIFYGRSDGLFVIKNFMFFRHFINFVFAFFSLTIKIYRPIKLVFT